MKLLNKFVYTFKTRKVVSFETIKQTNQLKIYIPESYNFKENKEFFDKLHEHQQRQLTKFPVHQYQSYMSLIQKAPVDQIEENAHYLINYMILVKQFMLLKPFNIQLQVYLYKLLSQNDIITMNKDCWQYLNREDIKEFLSKKNQYPLEMQASLHFNKILLSQIMIIYHHLLKQKSTISESIFIESYCNYLLNVKYYTKMDFLFHFFTLRILFNHGKKLNKDKKESLPEIQNQDLQKFIKQHSSLFSTCVEETINNSDKLGADQILLFTFILSNIFIVGINSKLYFQTFSTLIVKIEQIINSITDEQLKSLVYSIGKCNFLTETVENFLVNKIKYILTLKNNFPVYLENLFICSTKLLMKKEHSLLIKQFCQFLIDNNFTNTQNYFIFQKLGFFDESLWTPFFQSFSEFQRDRKFLIVCSYLILFKTKFDEKFQKQIDQLILSDSLLLEQIKEMKERMEFIQPLIYKYTLENQVGDLLDTLCINYQRNVIIEGMEVDYQLENQYLIEVNGPKHFVFHLNPNEEMIQFQFNSKESKKFGLFHHLLARFKREVLVQKGYKVIYIDFYENMDKSLTQLLTEKLGLK